MLASESGKVGALIKVGICGALGKNGKILVELLTPAQDAILAAAVVREGHCKIGAALSKSDLKYCAISEQIVAGADVWIDFSVPESSSKLVSLCAQSGTPVLVATTGHSDAQYVLLKEAAKKTAVLLAPNTSLCVHALQKLALEAQRLLGRDCDIEIFEMHHRQKKDSPSGTALALGNALREKYAQQLILDRSPLTTPRSDSEIGVVAARGGDNPGEHTVFFMGDGERLELTIRVRDRSVYATGALKLAKMLVGKSPGLYCVGDIVGQV